MMNYTFFGNTRLYRTSEDKSFVELSDEMIRFPLECRIRILTKFINQLKEDIEKYDDPRYLKKTFTRDFRYNVDPSKQTLRAHLEVTEKFIYRIQEKLLCS